MHVRRKPCGRLQRPPAKALQHSILTSSAWAGATTIATAARAARAAAAACLALGTCDASERAGQGGGVGGSTQGR